MRRAVLGALLALVWSAPSFGQTFVSPPVPLPTTQFVAGFTSASPGTVANLLATAPCSVTYVGQYADVSDLYSNGVAGGGIDDIVRCRYDATNNVYRWTPQREAYNAVATTTSGAVTLNPLVTPPVLRMTGTLLSTVTLTPSANNAYVGQRFKILMQGSIGAFTATITGLIGSNLTLLGNTSTTIEFGPTGWFSSGN